MYLFCIVHMQVDLFMHEDLWDADQSTIVYVLMHCKNVC